MKTQRIKVFALCLFVFGEILNGSLFSNSENKTSMNGKNFFSIESIQKKYPRNETLNMNMPQTIINKVNLKEIFESEELKIQDVGNDNIARLYSFDKNNERFQLKVIVTKSSLNAYNEALSLISSTSCVLFQIDSANPYFLGDWCVVNTRNHEGKYPPTIIIFTKNNLTIYAETNSRTNIRFYWDKIVKVNEKLSYLGEYVDNPHEINMKDIEKDIDQPTFIKNNTPKKFEEKKLQRSKKKYQSESWPKNNLAPISKIDVTSSIFPKSEIDEHRKPEEFLWKFDLHFKDSSRKVYNVHINIWIFSTIEEAEDKYLLLLEDWNVPPSARMENGPGRIAYSAGDEGIMFLYGNVIYESEDQGMDHLAVAKKMAEIIEKAPDLKPGEKPEIIFKK